MLIEDLVPGINLENYNTEFKGIIMEGPAAGNPEERLEEGWLKEIDAFANTFGGKLYVGVNNRTHEVEALDHQTADKITLMIQRQVQLHLEPPVHYTIEAIPVPGTRPIRYVLCIDVKKSQYPPVTLHFNGRGMIYTRHFGKTSVATGEEIRSMVLNSDNVTFDCLETDELFKKEDFKTLYSFYAEQNDGKELSEKDLISIRFMTADGYLRRGALLFRDDCQEDRTLVVCSQFPGITKGDDVFLATEEFKGNLIDCLRKSLAFVKNHSATGFIKTATGRKELVSYPARSLREGIVNALGYRNYFIEGSQIEINLYKDRLEIISPGSFIGGRQLENEKLLSKIPPLRRNELICGVFTLCKVMEHRASGFDKIEEEYSQYGPKYEPFANSDNQSFSLTLPDLANPDGLISNNEEVRLHTVVPLKGKYDYAILSYCYNKPRTVEQIAAHIGIKTSSYLRNTLLNSLVKNGYLIRQDTFPVRYQTLRSSVILD